MQVRPLSGAPIWRYSLVVEQEPLKLRTGVRFSVAPPISGYDVMAAMTDLKTVALWACGFESLYPDHFADMMEW